MQQLILLFIFFTSLFATTTLHQTINVGVLSFRPLDENQKIWKPLKDEVHAFNPFLDLNITSGSLEEIEKLTEKNSLDFVVVHPAAFVEMEYKYGISNIASIVRESTSNGNHLTTYGGVIVALSNRHDVHTLLDVRGKTIVTTYKEGFAAMLMQQETLSEVGIDILRDCKMLYTGQPSDTVIDALRAGKADIAFVRTGYIEEMISKGKLTEAELTIINPQKEKNFPFLLSTKLYPEWAVASTPRPSADTIKEFTIALYQIHTDDSKDFHEFSIPLSNQAARELMQKFHVYPFDTASTLQDTLKKYSIALITFFALLAIGSVLFTLYYFLSKRRVFKQAKQIELILATASDGIHVHDTKGNLILFSDSFAQMLGYTRDVTAKLTVYDWDKHFDPKKITDTMESIRDKTIKFETKHLRKNGTEFDVEIHAKGIIINGNHYIFASARDITHQKEDQNRLLEEKNRFDHLAHHDPLTGLPNRLSLIEDMEDKISHYSDHPFALMFLDLDSFKEINDSFGHRFGDQLLVLFSKLLQNLLPDDTFIVRTGGDEFVILMMCKENKGQIEQLLLHLIQKLNDPFNIDLIDVYITASIGIAIYPQDGSTHEELLQKADAAMYNAKNIGKNTYSFYNTLFTEKALQRTILSTQLKKAIHNNELELYFQPQVDVDTGNIIGAEALMRWMTQNGMIPPSVFIPIAEESGLILEVGKFALMQGCSTAVALSNEEMLHGRIAINVSARQLAHLDFLATLDDVLKVTQCNPQYIELEITESSILENPEKMIALLSVIKSKGFNISIDDFGTGYSSLSYLKNLPIDKLKIDQSFIRNITHEHKNQTIVKTIISLAKGLGMSVLAEGVETEDEMLFLRNNGIDSIQGYYYHKPMKIDAFRKILK
ncbi:MAG: EAL domain-containing protein [Sulfuricurvum sp.]